VSSRTLIVGGRTYDISEFDIFEHVKATDPLLGRFQYRLRARGWWGPMVGYKQVRYVITIRYVQSNKPRWFEVTVSITIAEEANPSDLDEYVMTLAQEVLAENWVDLPWDEVEVKGHETIMHTGAFDSTIHITVMDKDASRQVLEIEQQWTEEEMRHEAGLD